MALKFQKHKKTETTFTFTGCAFAQACFEAGVNKWKMHKLTKHRPCASIYPARYETWITQGSELITVNELTMDMILEVLEANSKHSEPQETLKK